MPKRAVAIAARTCEQRGIVGRHGRTTDGVGIRGVLGRRDGQPREQRGDERDQGMWHFELHRK